MASKGLQETSKLYSKGKEKISELELGEKVSAFSEDAKILIAEKMNSQPEVQNKIDQSQNFIQPQGIIYHPEIWIF